MEIDQPFKRNFDVGKVRTECLTNNFNKNSGITENASLTLSSALGLFQNLDASTQTRIKIEFFEF